MKAAHIAAVTCIFAMQAAAIGVSDRYRSPRNPERQVRRSTEMIVLHTTEAPARSSLNKVSDRGECHFVVTEDGSVYRIVDRDREAFHAGRSMWCGREDCDKYTVGIECVGYHDKVMPMAQIRAIRDLVKELQAMYRIPDEKVVAHSHVAYGAPNRWHHCRHRGRKRCGMLFAMPSVRRQLGLRTKPAFDPDVRAGRLRNCDDYLAKVLYGRVDTMAKAYASGGAATQSTGIFNWLDFGKKPASSSAKPSTARPAHPRPAPSKPGNRPAPRPAAAVTAAKTVPKSPADLKRGGFVCIGKIAKGQSAMKVAGAKWNSPDTFYAIRNKVIAGNQLNPAKIEVGMTVWRRK